MESFRVLVVDDEKIQREMIGGFLGRQGLEVHLAGSGPEALDIMRRERIDLILSDYKMPGMNGLELLKHVKGLNPEVELVILTAYGTIDTAVAAMKEGAYDYLTKPIDLDELLFLVHKVQERRLLIAENKELKSRLKERYRLENIIAESGAMQEVLSIVHRVAESDATVLIRGESGTGKELIAKAIHYNSPRHKYPLIKVNCAALPETLLESELFGHERGAFTGATSSRMGRFEAADKGTVFLDEIGDLSPAIQVKLLRVLQEREFERLGSNRTIRVDVRLIAATNRDLELAVREGRFRDDLYYRLSVVPIFIPPLRERRQDIGPLIDHFLKGYGKGEKGISSEARDRLMKYEYPGNIRELENIIERAVVLSRGPIITLSDLPLHLQRLPEEGPVGKLPELLASIERRMILEALEKNGWVQTRAAEELGISERVLRYKMAKHNLTNFSPQKNSLVTN